MKTLMLYPVIDSNSFKKIMNQIADAKAKNGEVICGGRQYDNKTSGYFIEPTIISNANEDMSIAYEETFSQLFQSLHSKVKKKLLKRQIILIMV